MERFLIENENAIYYKPFCEIPSVRVFLNYDSVRWGPNRAFFLHVFILLFPTVSKMETVQKSGTSLPRFIKQNIP